MKIGPLAPTKVLRSRISRQAGLADWNQRAHPCERTRTDQAGSGVERDRKLETQTESQTKFFRPRLRSRPNTGLASRLQRRTGNPNQAFNAADDKLRTAGLETWGPIYKISYDLS